MDHQEECQATSTARESLKRKLEPEFEDRNEDRKVLVVEDRNKDGSFSHFSHDIKQTSISFPNKPHPPTPPTTLPAMDHHEGQTTAARQSLKRKLEPEFEDQNEHRKVLVVEDQNKAVPITATSFSVVAQTLPSSSRPRSNHWNHDVFLSFKSEDTRKNFTDHLYSALLRVGILTFRDDEELPRGENITIGLPKAIRGSRISIVVFSKGYASSERCLDELVEIVLCKNTIGQTLLPVFYHLNPSDVRNQTGTFAEAFARHEECFQTDMERVKRWRAALTEAANCSGWDLENIANGFESNFIENIVEVVSMKVKPVELYVAKHPVGVDSRVKMMKALLNLEISDVRIVGIYGMGGIGKTTIAKAVYNDICDGFEGSSYLSNIKEKSKNCDGVVRLQKQLLSNILKMKNFEIDNVDGGIKLIEKRIQGKRVLVVLDDVDDLEQVYNLVGSFKRFGIGSRVIATTRDEHLLTQLGVSGSYKVEILNSFESLQLFSWHAFEMPHPEEDYHDLSISAVKYAGGLPLALEVLGSFLKRRSIIEWKNELEKLQKSPHNKIQKILRISFDSLDGKTMDIFLDIACIFIGMDKEYVNKILHGCDFFPDSGIIFLVQRSLLTIDGKHKLRMHDLIRDMGREIVREKSQGDLEKSSRLWFHEDALKVLSKHMGSNMVEGLVLNPPELEAVHLKTEAFGNMKNLRLLQINSVILNLEGCFKQLSKELRWLCWNKCPLPCLPPRFHLENLVVLDMQHSDFKQVWKENRILNKLKVLNLSFSQNLTKSPDFLQFPHLEMLVLEGCTSLVELHKSIEYLKGLVLLNLKGCKKLRNLPISISNLISLETLNLSGCLKLDKLPEQLGNMMALKKQIADKTAIKQLPGYNGQSSESRLSSSFLSWLASKSWNPISFLRAPFSGFCSLGRLALKKCKLSEEDIPIGLGNLSSLRKLDLSENNFCNLPHCIIRLPKLEHLHLVECRSLHSISGLSANVRVLFAYGCSSVERISILPSSKLNFLWVDRCSKLVEIQGLSLESKTSTIQMAGCDNLSSDFRKSLLQYPSTKFAAPKRFIFLPGSEVPNWFSQRIGSSVSFHVPSLSDGEIRRLHICAVYSRSRLMCQIRVIIHNKTTGYRELFLPSYVLTPGNNSDNLFLFQSPLIRNKLAMFGAPEKKMEMVSGEEVEVSFEIWNSVEMIQVQKCGVHLVVDEPKVIDKFGSSVDSDIIAEDEVPKGDVAADDGACKGDDKLLQ